MRLGVIALCVVGTSGCDRVFSHDYIPPPVDAPVDSALDAPPTGACPAVFNGKRYLNVDTAAVSWLTAEAACVALDDNPGDSYFTHLAVFETPGEPGLIGVPAGQEPWVGYTDRARNPAGPPPVQADFQWITNAPTQPALWGSGEPDSSSDPPYCAWLYAASGTLHDSGCDTTPHSYVCECDLYPEEPSRIFPAANGPALVR